MVQNSISEESCTQREASAKEDAETTSALPSSYICLRAGVQGVGLRECVMCICRHSQQRGETYYMLGWHHQD